MPDPTSMPPMERARGDGWGGDGARDAIRQIAEDLRLRTGVRHLRGRGAATRRHAGVRRDRRQRRRRRGDAAVALPFAAMKPALSLGAEYGAWTFVAQEWLTPEARRLLNEYCWIPEIEDTEDPDQWRALDILVARIVDDRGHLHALMYLDEPVSGQRPSPTRLRSLAQETQLALRAVLTAIEREELGQQLRLADTAREVVRAASSHGGYVDLLNRAHDHVVAGFRAQDVTVRVFADPRPEWPESSAAHFPPHRSSRSSRRPGAAWAAQHRADPARPGLGRRPARAGTPGRPDPPPRPPRRQRGGRGTRRGRGGAARHAGHRARARRAALDRGRELGPALDIGHDLGRAVLNTRAHERELELIAELRRLDQLPGRAYRHGLPRAQEPAGRDPRPRRDAAGGLGPPAVRAPRRSGHSAAAPPGSPPSSTTCCCSAGWALPTPRSPGCRWTCTPRSPRWCRTSRCARPSRT